MKNHRRYLIPIRQRGFTIVELLVVIVVIAILAAISTIVFSGIRERALQTSVKTGLNDTVRRIEADKATRGEYASSLDDLENSSSSNTSGVNYQYTGGGTSYCLSATLQTHSYHTCTDYAEVREGVYAEHIDPNAPAPQTEIVHTQKGQFSLGSPLGGSTAPVNIDFNLRPDDVVFILFNSNYRTVMTINHANSSPVTKAYDRSMGTSGYQRVYAFRTQGLTGPQVLEARVCWLSCSDATSGTTAGGAYIVYVIRGIGADADLNITETAYGSNPTLGSLVSPAQQSVKQGDIAIFTYSFYGNVVPALSDASTPAQTWSIDSQRTNDTAFYTQSALTAIHLLPTEPVNASYQVHMPSSGAVRRTGTTLFTLKPHN